MDKPYIEIAGGDIILYNEHGEIIKTWNRKDWTIAPDIVFIIVDLSRNLDNLEEFNLALNEYNLAI